jgi:hypothetical protein
VTDLPLDKLPRGWKVAVRREVKKLPEILGEGETVTTMAQGKYEHKQGLIVATDRRVLFMEEGLVRHRLEDFPYTRISSVQTESGMVRGKLTIYASGTKAVIEDVMPKSRADEIGAAIRAKLTPQ